MSGGSWDYVSFKFDEVADRLRGCKCPYRRALGERVSLIAKALHEIEWVDSNDTCHPDEMPSIMEALGKSADADALGMVVRDAVAIHKELGDLIAKVK